MTTSASAASVSFHGAIPTLCVKELNASIDYYVNVLGFKMDFFEAGIIAGMSRGECHIYLIENDQGHSGTWVWVGVSDSTALHEELVRKGAKIRMPPTNYPWSCEVQVEDPDGHVLRFGSEPRADLPMGEWVDMRGTRWTPLPQGRWKQADQLTDADRAAQGVAQAWRDGKKDEVRRGLEKAVELWRQSSEADAKTELAVALRILGEFERNMDQMESARKHYEEAVALLREVDEPIRLAHTLRHRGDIHHRAKRTAAAEECYVTALELYRRDGKLRPLDIGNVIRRMAVLKEENGDDASALRLWQEAYASYVRTGYPPAIAESAAWIARLTNRSGDRPGSREWLAKAQAAAEQCGDDESGENETRAHVEKVRAEIGG